MTPLSRGFRMTEDLGLIVVETDGWLLFWHQASTEEEQEYWSKKAMAEIIHLCCDRCGLDVIDDSRFGYAKGWANCHADLVRFNFCPACWQAILEFIKRTG